MIELSSFEAKVGIINYRKLLFTALHLYSNLAYSIVYKIIKSYKNYLGLPKIAIYNRFNKMMLKRKIEVKYDFAIYQNF